MTLTTVGGKISVTGDLDAGTYITAKTVSGDIVAKGDVTAIDNNVSLTSKSGNIYMTGDIDAGHDVIAETGGNGIIFLNGYREGNVLTGDEVWNGNSTKNNVFAGHSVNLITENTGVLVTGKVKANKGDVNALTKTGAIIFVGDVEAGTDIIGTATQNGQIWYDGTTKAGQDVIASTAQGDILYNKTVTAGRSVTASTDMGQITYNASIVAGDSILADTLKGDIYVGENLTAGNGISVTEDGPDPELKGMVTLTTGDGMLTVGNKNNTGSGNITAYGNVIIDTQKGDATVKTSVTSRAGSVSISSDNGNINVGELQVANAISAKKDIDLHVADGTIRINGTTKTQNGDITVYAHDEDKPDNIVITQNGKLDSARDLTLHSYNGGITVTKDTTAQRDLTVIVENEGNVKFAENVTVSGNIYAYAGKGDMTVGKGLTADKSIFVKTGSGHVTVGAKVTAKTDSVVVKTGGGNVTVGEDITAGTTVELSSNAGDITVGDADGGNVKAEGNIDITTKAGGIEVVKTVVSDDGNVKVTSDYGNVRIGSNGADVRTVYAKGDIDVHVTEGVIQVQGKTETAKGNITMDAHNEKDVQNIVINQDGKLVSGQDLTLHAYNGNIQVTENTTAQRDLTVMIDNKGSVDFNKNVDVKRRF